MIGRPYIMEINEITPAFLRKKVATKNTEAEKALAYLLYSAMCGNNSEAFFNNELKKKTITELRNLGFQVKWFKCPFEKYVVSFSENSINDLTEEDQKIKIIKEPETTLKITTKTANLEKKLKEVKKSIEALNNTKIIINIEHRTITKRWWQFWK